MSEAIEILKRIEVQIGELGKAIIEAIEKNGKKPQRKKVDAALVRDAMRTAPHPLATLWNEWKQPGFTSVAGMSTASPRYKNAEARWHERPDKEYWVKVIKRVNDSKFCNGDNERGWKADFEFLVRPDNHFRILEGKYDKCHSSYKKEDTPKEKRFVGYVDGEPVYEVVK